MIIKMFTSGLLERDLMTPLMLTIIDNNLKCFDKLMKDKSIDVNRRKYCINALNIAVEIGNPYFILTLIGKGAKIRGNGYDSLMLSLMLRKIDIFNMLMIYVRPISDGSTVLCEVISKADNEMVIDIVLSKVKDKVRYINMEDVNGNTPLILAIRKKKVKVVDYLLKRGASMKYMTYKGETGESVMKAMM